MIMQSTKRKTKILNSLQIIICKSFIKLVFFNSNIIRMKKLTLTAIILTMCTGTFYAQNDGVKTIGVEQVNTNITVKSIGEKYIEAIGGKAAVDKVMSVEFEASGEMQGTPIGVNILNTRDGKSASAVIVNGEVFQRVVWDGNDGYMEMQGNKTPFPDEAKEEMKKVSKIFPEEEFGNNPDLKLDGTEMINGENSYKITGKDVTYYYSIKTGLKTGETISSNVGGQVMTIPMQYSDYKEIDGVKYPFAFSQEMMGMKTDYKISKYTINEAKDEDFK